MNFSQPFEGFTVDRSLLDESLEKSPIAFWLPAERQISVRPSARRPGRFGWALRRLAVGFGLAGLCLGLFISFTAYRLGQVSRQVFRGGSVLAYALQEELNPAELTREGDSRINLLLAGKGGPGHDGPNLTDSIIIASFDPNGQSATLLSLPRDWQVELPGSSGDWVRINAVYALIWEQSYRQTTDRQAAETAGLQALEKVIEQKLDLPIHYHVLVDFDGFVGLVDIIGGVELEIPARLYDVRAELDLQPGRQVLDGRQALAYARARYTVRGGDFGRSSHQRELLLALQDKTSSLGVLSVAFKANQIITTLGDSVVTNLSLDEAKRLYRVTQQIPADNLTSLDLVSQPILLGPQDHEGQAVLWPVAGQDDYSQIRRFVRQQLQDSFIRQEAARVAVWRSGQPAGPDLIDQLESYGYQIIANQATEISVSQPTLVVTGSETPYTGSYLSKRFSAKVASAAEVGLELDDAGADLIIILPSDYET